MSPSKGISGIVWEMKVVTDVDDHISSCQCVSTRSILFILAATGAWGGPVSWSQHGPTAFLNQGKPMGGFLEKA